MVRNVERWALGIGAVLLAALGLGCPNSDVLTTQPGRGILTVQVQLPSGTGRYERGSFSILAVKVRPVDPQANSSLAVPITILDSSQLTLSLTDLAPISTGGVPLSEGDYDVVSLTVDFISIVDENAPAPPNSCLDAVVRRQFPAAPVPLPPPETGASHAVEITAFDPPPRFHVNRNGEGTIKLNVDGSALFALVEGGLQGCRPTFCSGESGRLCAIDADCTTPVCNRPPGSCSENPEISCGDTVDCPPGDTCDRPAGSCNVGGTLCAFDTDCVNVCFHGGQLCGTTQPPCFTTYAAPTADQLRTILTFE